jgi:hypothetical protein
MDFYEGVVPPWILQAMFESMYFNYLKMMNLFGEDEFNDMLDATEEYYTAMERIESGAKESLELRKKVAGLDPAYIAFDEFGRDDKLPQ